MTTKEDLQLRLKWSIQYHSMYVASCAVRPEKVQHAEPTSPQSSESTTNNSDSFSTCLAAASNYFTYSGAYLTFAQYRFALRARLNLLPTRTVQARSGKVLPDTRCRHCHQVPETLSHITNHCLHNMGLIREHHNAVLERLIRAIPPSMGDKFKEQPLPNTTGANRPDLTIV